MYIDIHTHHLHEATDGLLEIHSFYSDFSRVRDGRPCSVGVHPCFMDNRETLLQEVYPFATLPNVLAIGECGLDRVCNKDMGMQAAAFGKQVELANRLGKPLIIHCVRAYDELLKVLDEHVAIVPVIVHGFNKKRSVAERLLANGMYLSFGAAIMNDKSPAAGVLEGIAADKFFLETDDTAIGIEDIYQRAATIRNTSVAAVISQIEQNFKKVFKTDI